MPYQTPSPVPPPPLSSRDNHRRNRSAMPTFSNERGPGAFAPLANIPRRPKPADKRPMFEFNDENDGSASDGSPPPSEPLLLRTESAPAIAASSIPLVPFPTTEPLPSPRSANGLPRVPSTPIMLSNGKPLKPSLKSSLSSPALTPVRSMHSRAQSEPSTPSTPHKNVHFPEKDTGLESIVVFEKSQRPRAVSGNLGDETETETEGYDSSAGPPASKAFPFPILGDNTLELDTSVTSPIPNPIPPQYANIHLETLAFPSTRPPTLRGSVIVRNINFEKIVAVRFTLDDWQTTSEVTCKHVCSLPSLPHPFPQEKLDIGAIPTTWDRFSFLVRLEDVERKLAERTIWMVARYTVPGEGGGEWWDNNTEANYRIAFRRSSVSVNRTLSAPSKLARSGTFTPGNFTPPVATFTPVSSHVRAATSPVVGSTRPPAPTPPQRTSSASISPTIGSLRLSNYVPPTTPPTTPKPPVSTLLPPLHSSTPGAIIGGQPTSSPPIGSHLTWPGPKSEKESANSYSFRASANGTTVSGKIDTNDSSYAAFVKQWCFHQSPSTLSPATTDPNAVAAAAAVGMGLKGTTLGNGLVYRSSSPVAGLS